MIDLTYTVQTREPFNVASHGTMRGAHGQPDALHWVVLPDGTTLFHDTARNIYGAITPGKWETGGACGKAHPSGPFTGAPGAAAVRWGYLDGYAYGWDRGNRAACLGSAEIEAIGPECSMTAPNETPELSSAEARQIMRDAIPRDCGVRAVASDVNEQDAVVYWTAVIFDPLLPGGEDAIGTVQFSEHWPQVDIDWR